MEEENKNLGKFNNLYNAVLEKNYEEANSLINGRVDINGTDEKLCTLLHIAAANNDEEMVKLLISEGLSINALNKNKRTPLHLAAIKNSIDVARLLICKGADINATDKYGKTLLHLAAGGNSIDVAQLLIDIGADINAKDEHGRTPLHLAAIKKSIDVAQLLIDKRADINAKDKHGRIPLHLAARENSIGVAQRLLIKDKKNVNVNVIDKDWRTPLYLAAIRNSIEVTQLLISNNAKVSIVDKDGRTPLHLAAIEKSIGVARLLIDKRADINATDKDERTPLHFAVMSEDNKELIELLISKGADINVVDKYGNTTFDIATENEVKELLEREIILKACLDDDKSAVEKLYENNKYLKKYIKKNTNLFLENIFKNCSIGVLKFFILNDLIDYKDKENNTILHLVVSSKSIHADKILDFLINDEELKTKINIEDKNSNTLLHNADKQNSSEVLKYEGFYHKKTGTGKVTVKLPGTKKKDIRNSTKNTIIDPITEVKFLKEMRMSNRKGSVKIKEDKTENYLTDIDAVNGGGNTASHVIANRSGFKIAKTLIDAGANIEIKNKGKKTPLDIADENGSDVKELLIKETPLDVACDFDLCSEESSIERRTETISLNIEKPSIEGSTETTFSKRAEKTAGYVREAAKKYRKLGNTRGVTTETKKGPEEYTKKNEDLKQELCNLLKSESNEYIKAFINKNECLMGFKYNDEEYSLLHLVINSDNYDLINFLIGRGIDLLSRDRDGNTPLHFAISNSKEKAVNSLILSGEDSGINCKNNEGYTPLHFAIMFKSNKKLIELLISKGANINAINKYGYTPLHLAVMYKDNEELIKMLISERAYINAEDEHGITPLHLAVMYKDNEELIKMLISERAYINAEDKYRRTPLDIAYECENTKICELLTKNGAKANFQNLDEAIESFESMLSITRSFSSRK